MYIRKYACVCMGVYIYIGRCMYMYMEPQVCKASHGASVLSLFGVFSACSSLWSDVGLIVPAVFRV